MRKKRNPLRERDRVKVYKSQHVGTGAEEMRTAKAIVGEADKAVKTIREFLEREGVESPMRNGFLASTAESQMAEMHNKGFESAKEDINDVLGKYNPRNPGDFKNVLLDRQGSEREAEENAEQTLGQLGDAVRKIEEYRKQVKASTGPSFKGQAVAGIKELSGLDLNLKLEKVISEIAKLDADKLDAAFAEVAKHTALEEIYDNALAKIAAEGNFSAGRNYLEERIAKDDISNFGAASLSTVAPAISAAADEQARKALFQNALPKLEEWSGEIAEDLKALKDASDKEHMAKLNSELLQFFTTAHALRKHSTPSDKGRLESLMRQLREEVNKKASAPSSGLVVTEVSTRREKGHLEAVNKYLSSFPDLDEKQLAEQEAELKKFAESILMQAFDTAYAATAPSMDRKKYDELLNHYMGRIRSLGSAFRGTKAGSEIEGNVTSPQFAASPAA